MIISPCFLFIFPLFNCTFHNEVFRYICLPLKNVTRSVFRCGRMYLFSQISLTCAHTSDGQRRAHTLPGRQQQGGNTPTIKTNKTCWAPKCTNCYLYKQTNWIDQRTKSWPKYLMTYKYYRGHLLYHTYWIQTRVTEITDLIEICKTLEKKFKLRSKRFIWIIFSNMQTTCNFPHVKLLHRADSPSSNASLNDTVLHTGTRVRGVAWYDSMKIIQWCP